MKPPYLAASCAIAVSFSTSVVCPMTKEILMPVLSSYLHTPNHETVERLPSGYAGLEDLNTVAC